MERGSTVRYWSFVRFLDYVTVDYQAMMYGDGGDSNVVVLLIIVLGAVHGEPMDVINPMVPGVQTHVLPSPLLIFLGE